MHTNSKTGTWLMILGSVMMCIGAVLVYRENTGVGVVQMCVGTTFVAIGLAAKKKANAAP